MYACPHDLVHNMHIQGKQHRSIVVKKRCCSQWQPTPPFEALPAGFLTTLRQFPATTSLPCQFLTSGKITRSLICPTTFQAREARSLHSLVQSASSTAVEATQAQFPMFPMFPNQLLSINLPAFLRLFESILHALQSLCMPAHMTLCTTCTSKESNIDQSW